MFNKIFIVPKLNDTDSLVVDQVSRAVRKAAGHTDHSAFKVLTERGEIDDQTLIIAIGGDGTMLEAMRIAAHTGAIATGINLGNVGFLTDIGYEKNTALGSTRLCADMINIFDDPDEYFIEHRMSLTAIRNEGNRYFRHDHMFNEFVLSNTQSDELIKYRLEIDGVDAGHHRANAIIVGTPTGSTAYTLSNGGSLLYPSMNVMQIVPVAPLSLTSRPIIVPGSSQIAITIETNGSATLRGDGKELEYFLKSDNPTVTFTQFHSSTRILHPKGWNFFDMLTNKLHWRKS